MSTAQSVVNRKSEKKSKVTKSSLSLDDTQLGDNKDVLGPYDEMLVEARPKKEDHGPVGIRLADVTATCKQFLFGVARRLYNMFFRSREFHWIDFVPAPERFGLFMMKAVGVVYIMIILFDIYTSYGSPYASVLTTLVMLVLLVAIIINIVMISRRYDARTAVEPLTMIEPPWTYIDSNFPNVHEMLTYYVRDGEGAMTIDDLTY